MKAIGIGIHDSYFLSENVKYPYPIGIEASGMIEKVGEHVTVFKKGESIAFISNLQAKGGTWVEYAMVIQPNTGSTSMTFFKEGEESWKFQGISFPRSRK